MADNDTSRATSKSDLAQRSLDVAGDDLIVSASQSAVAGRPDCCSANASVRVVLPPKQGKTRAVLLLCGHHYRASHAKLVQAGVTVFDASDTLLLSPEFIPPASSYLWPSA